MSLALLLEEVVIHSGASIRIHAGSNITMERVEITNIPGQSAIAEFRAEDESLERLLTRCLNKALETCG